jgi:hypothetical protein
MLNVGRSLLAFCPLGRMIGCFPHSHQAVVYDARIDGGLGRDLLAIDRVLI